MNNQTQHTPTYWNFEKEYGRYIITGARGQFIGSICSLSPKPNRDKANAEHIVKCVNMHDDLINTLDELLMAAGKDRNIPNEIFLRAKELLNTNKMIEGRGKH